MVFKRFRIHVIARTLVLAFSATFFSFLLFRTQLFAALFIMAVLIIYQVYSLIRYVEVTNRDLTRFFESIKYGDFTQSFKDDKLGRSFAALRQTYNEVADAFRATRAEKEEHYRYLQTVVQHVGVGLIAFQPDGEVELINTAAKRLLNISHLKNIKSLNSLSPKLVKTLFRLKPRETDLVKVESESESLQLSLYSTEFKLRSQVFSLVSLQNIHSELEEIEIEAWQRLIRVLTHEIMNSITPISSLASTIQQLIRDGLESLDLPEGSDPEMLDDIQQALYTIQRRSKGLMHFVDAYRNYTLTPKANFSIFPVRELFARVEKLMQANIKDRGILFKSGVEPENLELTADPELIEQVLINLLLNALQSVEKKEGGRIDVLALLDAQGRILIQVKDNGPGIQEENLDKIFIPFFSTKEGGSGIGLSLSRQIMRQHKGTISVHSDPEQKTVFTLRF
jgi:nitrogen fixation/metabolism regulation signal transduction histidine kinase